MEEVRFMEGGDALRLGLGGVGVRVSGGMT